LSTEETIPQTLTRRSDFLRAARSRHVARPGFILQARKRTPDEADGVRIGYTCSKKVGNAVRRNRAKRRLRAVARDVLPGCGRDGWDYVLIGRPETTQNQPFDEMVDDLKTALEKIHGNGT